MHPFALSRANDLAQAIAGHAPDPGLAFIAGGTDLIGLIKDVAALPKRLLHIDGLPDMARSEALPDGGLRIGPLARMGDVAADAEVRRRFPVIAEALLFLLRQLFETVVRRCVAEDLVGGEGFAVDASIIVADAHRDRDARSTRPQGQ